MQLDEGDFEPVLLEEAKDQILDAAKGANPDKAIWMHGRIISEKGAGACVVGKRVGRIWKGPFPQLDGAVGWIESDVSEKVFSSSRNPRFGDDAARFERSRFIVQVVDDEIE